MMTGLAVLPPFKFQKSTSAPEESKPNKEALLAYKDHSKLINDNGKMGKLRGVTVSTKWIMS